MDRSKHFIPGDDPPGTGVTEPDGTDLL